MLTLAQQGKLVALIVITLLGCSPLSLISQAAELPAGSGVQEPAAPVASPEPLLTRPPAASRPASAGSPELPLNPNPPAGPVKLVFVHHSSGENWLRDDNGNLGRTLDRNNYYVGDTNYGWGPDGIGDRTDITDWLEWFRSPQTGLYLAALYAESGQSSEYTRRQPDPGGENRIVMIKSCFPNSNLEGNPGDLPAQGDGLTVSNAKYIYTELLQYFATRPDKLFVVITAPPVSDGALAGNARALNTWLVHNWLQDNHYPLPNVAVFDFYNVLTGRDNHHRFRDGMIEYVADRGRNTAFYPSARDDDHPSAAGNQKATSEFVPFLNVAVHCWQGDGGCPRR